MKKYFKMKYEQWLMRLFDWVCKKLIKTDNEWVIYYPSKDVIQELEDKWMGEIERGDHLEYQILDREDRIHELEDKLDWYEYHK